MRLSTFILFLILSAAPKELSAADQHTPFQSPPASQIIINDVHYAEPEPGKYVVSGNLGNPTQEPREVVVRGQLAFFDRAVPKGDLPLFVLKKDTTLILRAGETRSIEMSLINEGGMPRGAFRAEPVIRVRRQRIWNY